MIVDKQDRFDGMFTLHGGSLISCIFTEGLQFSTLVALVDFNDYLSKLISSAHELETLLSRFQPVQHIRDDRFDFVFSDEVRCVNEVLLRTHG